MGAASVTCGWPVLALVVGASCAVAVGAEASLATQAAVSGPFERGTRYGSVAAGASRNTSVAYVYLAQFSISHYVADNLAFDYGVQVGYADAKRMSGGLIGGPEIGMRWHFAKTKRWSTYVESVAGLAFQQNPLTDSSFRFNFDLQPGGGATYRVNKKTLLQGGFRWHHLSNARIRGKEHNFGYDAPLFYLGMMRSF